MERNVNIVRDKNGDNVVVINEIRFRGKRSVKWKDVKEYLEKFADRHYTISATKDVVYIGKDLPDEYTGSKYTYSLKGTVAKAKANAAQGIPEMLEIATGKKFEENREEKHQWNAKMAGTSMIQGLHFQFWQIMEMWIGIMSFI